MSYESHGRLLLSRILSSPTAYNGHVASQHDCHVVRIMTVVQTMSIMHVAYLS